MEIKILVPAFSLLDNWLSRTPFVNMQGYDFWQVYRKTVEDMLTADEGAVKAAANMSDGQREAELGKLKFTRQQFGYIFDDKASAGTFNWKLSKKALHAALFITLYRDQPVLQVPYTILASLMDMDEMLTIWRFRHGMMAQRMLGFKMGSGGSSGHEYLMKTTDSHRVFKDLFALATFLIPRSRLPELPQGIEDSMGFKYASGSSR